MTAAKKQKQNREGKIRHYILGGILEVSTFELANVNWVNTKLPSWYSNDKTIWSLDVEEKSHGEIQTLSFSGIVI